MSESSKPSPNLIDRGSEIDRLRDDESDVTSKTTEVNHMQNEFANDILEYTDEDDVRSGDVIKTYHAETNF